MVGMKVHCGKEGRVLKGIEIGGAGTKETCILLLKHRAMLIYFSSSFVYLGRELERNGKARQGQ